MIAALTTAVGLGALLFWALAVGRGDSGPGPTGLPDPGPVVEWGQPLVTLAGRIAAVGTVGTLVYAAIMLPGSAGRLGADARRALGAASVWSLTWALATAAGAVLTLSRLVGTAPSALSWATFRVFLEDTGPGRAAVLVVALAAALGATASRCTGTDGARVLLVVALTTLLAPVLLTGHESGTERHLTAAATLGLHVVAATVWVGGLLALVVHGRHGVAVRQSASRFSRVALVCFLATAASGVLAAWQLIGGTAGIPAALASGYGVLLLAKTAGLTLLGLFGWQHRRRSLPRLRRGDTSSFRRFAAGEVLLMLATVTLAVALAASPPPGRTTSVAAEAPQAAGAPAAPADAPADPMAGHDHGELSVGVLVDDTRFHVAGPVAAGARVTVHNATTTQVSLTADDGSFDVVVPAGSLMTFVAPQRPGAYPFTSHHSAAFADLLVVE